MTIILAQRGSDSASTPPTAFATQACVGGVWTDTSSSYAVTDPADGSLIAEVANGDADTAQAALDAAVLAFASWRKSSARERSIVLRSWFEAVTERGEALAGLITRETGKPLAESLAEVAYGASYIEWFAEETKRSDGDVLGLAPADRQALVLREPVGVVAIVTPWNFPLAMLARKIAPAIAAGCAVVVKPAEDTPLSALALAQLAECAGMPAGLINVVPASRERAAEVVGVWMKDQRVRKVSFTGSTAVGKMLARDAAETLKRVSLELGGDAPFLVFEDADIDAAVAALTKAKFRNAGQACVAVNRVLVHQAVVGEFTAALKTAVSALTVGPAAEGAFDIGPLINDAAVIRVTRLIKEAVDGGAEMVVGGGRHPRGGRFVAPTLLLGVAPQARLLQEEIFGPVIAISTFADEAEAFERANDTRYGLAAYVCTRDAARMWRAASALECGMVGVNEGAISAEFAPFGGVKESGYGREGSRYGLAEYQTLKYVCLASV